MTSAKIASITDGPRQSNFELLRIVSMLLVLAVHANYFSIGTPSLGELREHVVPTVTRVFLEAACLVCVNVFVLISGWFGIRRSVKGGVSYIFQCLFYSVVIYGLFLLLRLDTFSHIKMFEAFYVYRGGGWFVVAYLGLYILAPVLNAYIEKVSVRQLAMTVLGFYVFQTIFGCVGHYDFFSLGYSTLSFVGLYMLARLIRKSGWILPPPILSYLAGTLATTVLLVVHVLWPGLGAVFMSQAYCSPFVVFSSVALMMCFAGLKIGVSPFVNSVAKSAFAVYLIHMNPCVAPYYARMCRWVYDSFDGLVYLLAIGLTIFLVFAVCIIADKARVFVWNRLSAPLVRYTTHLMTKVENLI